MPCLVRRSTPTDTAALHAHRHRSRARPDSLRAVRDDLTGASVDTIPGVEFHAHGEPRRDHGGGDRHGHHELPQPATPTGAAAGDGTNGPPSPQPRRGARPRRRTPRMPNAHPDGRPLGNPTDTGPRRHQHHANHLFIDERTSDSDTSPAIEHSFYRTPVRMCTTNACENREHAACRSNKCLKSPTKRTSVATGCVHERPQRATHDWEANRGGTQDNGQRREQR